jgi:Pyruvate/2-oxoacid:ferredoxin oxidoreductase gamma subunit
VVVGFFTAVTGLLKLESAQRAVAESVPAGTQALNLQALGRGHSYGLQQAADLHVTVNAV